MGHGTIELQLLDPSAAQSQVTAAATFYAHAAPITAVALSPLPRDGDGIGVNDSGGVESGSGALGGSGAGVSCTLLTASSDCTVRLWGVHSLTYASH